MRRVFVLFVAAWLLLCARTQADPEIDITITHVNSDSVEAETQVFYYPYSGSDITITGTCFFPQGEGAPDFYIDLSIILGEDTTDETSIPASPEFAVTWHTNQYVCGAYVAQVRLWAWFPDCPETFDAVNVTLFDVQIRNTDGSAPETCIAKDGIQTYKAFVDPDSLSGDFFWDWDGNISASPSDDTCTVTGVSVGNASLSVEFLPYGGEQPAFDSVNLQIYCVDLDIERVTDNTDTDTLEVQSGGFLRLNDPTLRNLTLSGWPAGKQATLTKPAGSSKVKLYYDSAGANEIVFVDDKHVFDYDTSGETTIWAKGVALSSECRDITLTLSSGSGSNVSTDTVKLTVFQIDPDWADMQGANHETEEKDPGLYIPLNDDDDNADTIVDATQNDSGVYQENDLKKLFFRRTPAKLPGVYAATLEGPLSLWEDTDTDTEKQNAFTSMTLTDQYEADTWIWVEGVSVSSGLRDSHVKLTYTAPDGTTEAESVVATVYGVTTVTPAGAHKIFISIRAGDTFPDTSVQSENRKAKVTATITPAIQNVPVYLRTYDLDDASPYDSDLSGDDNRDTAVQFQYGSLETGYSKVTNSEEYYGGGNVRGLGIYTDAQGQVQATLQITNRYSGDNYGVYASTGDKPIVVNNGTGNLVAWKRVYVEQDRMFRNGARLAANFSPDANGDPDTLMLMDISTVETGQVVVVFDADTPAESTSAETAVITGIWTVGAWNFVSLNRDLENTYTVPAWGGIGVPLAGYYEPDVAGRTANAFGDSPCGDDGGCYVEWKRLSAGEEAVPYFDRFLDNEDLLNDFSTVWFNNAGESNYIHVLGLCYSHSPEKLTYMGLCSPGNNWSAVFVQHIEDDYSTESTPTVVADTTAHELGHQFFTSQTGLDLLHAEVWCHMGDQDGCLMGDANLLTHKTDPCDEYSEFCLDGDNHLKGVRDAPDGLL